MKKIGYETEEYYELPEWDRTWIAIEHIYKIQRFIAYHLIIQAKYGARINYNGKPVYYLPCRTWQQLMRDYGVVEECSLPRLVYLRGEWFCPPNMIMELIPEDLKSHFMWNFDCEECDNCEDREICTEEYK